MALTPQQSQHLKVLQTIERLGGSASYEKHLSKSSNSPALSIPSFANHDPVYAQIKITPLFGSKGGTAEVTLFSGLGGGYTTLLEFWVDEASAESTAGGVFGYIDWDFLLANEVNFAIQGLEHFDGATITISHEVGIIGKIDLIGSWSLAAVKEAHGTCQWKVIYQAQLQGQENTVLKTIKAVEKLGGSAEYARSLTDRGVPEIPDSANWPSTPCSTKNAWIGLLNVCTITAQSIHLGTEITTFGPVVPTTPDAKLLIKPGVKLEGQKCSWFIVPDKQEKSFTIGFCAGNDNIVALIQGPGRNVQPISGGPNLVTWTPINAA